MKLLLILIRIYLYAMLVALGLFCYMTVILSPFGVVIFAYVSRSAGRKLDKEVQWI